ncbi:ABC transporter substrate-binding protein [Aestuariivirga litoralis]|uniref:ABC transporter substrate-binding protein n=1 Tax=Aestuariivirga litoralis TaxID=2650924 RepID=UPI0018C4CE9B|nr:ABC transporter substrate-binding protein [Aestuariivirga litoralis]MBG1231975.1 ABC transporter substrate-binding protein [Aestuariivirga litoralis]
MISRRFFLALMPAVFAVPAMAADHPSVVFMNRMGDELLHAHRQGTTSAFMRVIQRYADINSIADESIGTYKVGDGDMARYKRGVATFISRYFADQSRSYQVAKFEVGEATVDKDKNVLVDSKVFLMSGQTYSVTWKLNWVGGSYKVADARFLGFSMTSMERNLFSSFLAKHDGDVKALIVALNRQ